MPSVSYYSLPHQLLLVFENLGHKEGNFSVAEIVASQCLRSPMSPYLTIEEQANIIDEILFFNIT